jgi:hypothetical protein
VARSKDAQNQLIWMHTRPSPVQFPCVPRRSAATAVIALVRNCAGDNVTNQQLLQRPAHLGDRATLDREDQASAHAAITIGPGR